MTAFAYYNEFDPFAADTLEELIRRGHIAPGFVDRRSILEVRADDLRGFCQAHFFAGVGVWSLAARRAGIPDDWPIWSGSAPCQPWSAAGKGKGADDERHLWPHWFENIIKECGPGVIFGEQVADASVLGKSVRSAGGGPDGAPRAWFDIISDDLESAHYAVGAVPFTSALCGAPHIRDRLYWVAESDNPQWWPDGAGGHDSDGADAGWAQGAGDTQGRRGVVGVADRDEPGLEGRAIGRDGAGQWAAGSGGMAGGMADADSEAGSGRGIQRPGTGPSEGAGATRERSAGLRQADGWGSGGLENATGERPQRGPLAGGEQRTQPSRLLPDGSGDDADGMANTDGATGGQGRPITRGGDSRSDAVKGTGLVGGVGACGPSSPHSPWGIADWLWCRDGKWRPVEPGSKPLAHGLARGMGALDAGLAGLADVAGLDGASLKRAKAYRVGALRAYGNAINAYQAEQFIRSWLAVRGR